MTPELTSFVIQLLLIVATGGGVYAAVRADLAKALQKSEMAYDGQLNAHRRITDHVEHFHTRKG